MKILVVDNDKNTIETIKAALSENKNLEVDVAFSGEAALEKIGSSPFYDLVILDIMMPGKSGMDVCLAMSESEKMRSVPVLLMSALPIDSADFRESLGKFNELRVVKDVLEKPFSVQGLLEKIRALTFDLSDSRNIKVKEASAGKKTSVAKGREEMENEKFFCQIISDIIIRMRNRVGFAAIEIAENIDGLKIDSLGRVLKVEKDPTEIIALLTLNYENFFYEKVFIPALWAKEGELVSQNIDIVKKYFNSQNKALRK
jgi:DNA-binding response OmpR family regulator